MGGKSLLNLRQDCDVADTETKKIKPSNGRLRFAHKFI